MLILDASCREVIVNESEMADLFRSVNKLDISLEGHHVQPCEAFICGCRGGGQAQVVASVFLTEEKRCLVYASEDTGNNETESREALQEAVELLEPLGFQMKRVHMDYGEAMKQVILKGVSGLRLGTTLGQRLAKRQGDAAKKRSRKGPQIGSGRDEGDFWPQEKEAPVWTGPGQGLPVEPSPVEEMAKPQEKSKPHTMTSGDEAADALRRELEQVRGEGRIAAEAAAAAIKELQLKMESVLARESAEQDRFRKEMDRLNSGREKLEHTVRELSDELAAAKAREAETGSERDEQKKKVAVLRKEWEAREHELKAELAESLQRNADLGAELAARNEEFAGGRSALEQILAARDKEVAGLKEQMQRLEDERVKQDALMEESRAEAAARVEQERSLQRQEECARVDRLRATVDAIWPDAGRLPAVQGLPPLPVHEPPALHPRAKAINRDPACRDDAVSSVPSAKQSTVSVGETAEEEPSRSAVPLSPPSGVAPPASSPGSAPPAPSPESVPQSAPLESRSVAASPEVAPASAPAAPSEVAGGAVTVRASTVVTLPPAAPLEPVKFEPADFGSLDGGGERGSVAAASFVLQEAGGIPALACGDVLQLYRSVNIQRVAPAGGAPQEGTAAACRYRQGGAEKVFAVIRLVKGGTLFTYEPAGGTESGESLQRSAVAFLEEIGFFMLPEELPLEPAARCEALIALNLFKVLMD